MPRKDHLPRQTRQEHGALSVHGKPLDSDADSGCVPCELSA